MTSKISSIKLIAGEIRRKAYLELMTVLVLFCMMPGYAMIRVECALKYMGTLQESNKGVVRNFFPGLINGGTFSLLMFVIGILAIVFAAAEFGYIHSREKIDFYHALPVKREKIFQIRYLSGLLIFLIPYVICTGLVILTGVTHGIMNGEVLVKSLQAMLGGILGFILIYHVGIVGMLLCGQTIIGIIASGVLLIYCNMVFSMVSNLGSIYFSSYSYRTGVTVIKNVGEYLSPGYMYYKLLLRTAEQETGSLNHLIVAALLMSVLLFAAGVLLHRRYPSEMAGKALAYPHFESLIKVMICVPAGITAGAFFYGYVIGTISGASEARWVIVLSIGITVIFCAVTDFLCHRDLKKIVQGWKASLISIGTVAIILLIFSLDLFGYDTYLPSADKLASVSFYPETLGVYFEYPEYQTEKEIKVTGEEKQLILDLAAVGIDNLSDGLSQSTLDEADDSYLSVAFCYQMKSGRKVQRCYIVGREDVLDTVEKLCEKEKYRKEIFPIFSMEEKKISLLSIRDIEGKQTALNLTEEERKQLLDAYKKDVLNADIRELDKNSAMGEMMITYAEEVQNEYMDWDEINIQGGISQINNFYIYADYKNTLSCLKEHGVEIQKSIDPAEVNGITIYDYEEEGGSAKAWLNDFLSQLKNKETAQEDGYGVRVFVTDPEDIQYVLKHILYGNTGILGNIGQGYSIYANISTIYGSNNEMMYYLK